MEEVFEDRMEKRDFWDTVVFIAALLCSRYTGIKHVDPTDPTQS